MALAYLKPCNCNCVRTVRLQNRGEFEYYNLGKVFRFNHVISATKVHSENANES